VRVEAQLYPVTDQWAAPVVPKAAACLALHDLIAGGHIVKAAERLFNSSSHSPSCSGCAMTVIVMVAPFAAEPLGS